MPYIIGNYMSFYVAGMKRSAEVSPQIDTHYYSGIVGRICVSAVIHQIEHPVLFAKWVIKSKAAGRFDLVDYG